MSQAGETIAILIPAFNEEKTVGAVIGEVREAMPEATIVVINDGSEDDTSAVARSHDAVVIDMPFNVGIGAAMQTGYRYARNEGYAIAVQVDGDGQHVPAEIPQLLKVLRNGADIVFGSRFKEKGSYRTPPVRRLGILFFSFTVSLFTRKRFYDTTSGFRAANRRVIEYFARHYPSDYPEPETILVLSRAGFRVEEIPALFRERSGGDSSITLFRGLFYMIKVFLALVMGTLRRHPKAKEE